MNRLLASSALLVITGLLVPMAGPATATESTATESTSYDMFINGSDTDEVMVWVDNQGQTPAGPRRALAKIDGQTFGLYVSGKTKSFVLTKNETKGTIRYLAILAWRHRHHMLASSDTLSQFNFGWEICDTGGKTRTFTVRELSLHQRF